MHVYIHILNLKPIQGEKKKHFLNLSSEIWVQVSGSYYFCHFSFLFFFKIYT